MFDGMVSLSEFINSSYSWKMSSNQTLKATQFKCTSKNTKSVPFTDPMSLQE